MERYYDNRYYDGAEAFDLDLFRVGNGKDDAYYERLKAKNERSRKEQELVKQRKTEKMKKAVSSAMQAGERANAIRLVICGIMALAVITTLVVSSAQNNNLMRAVNKQEQELESLEHEYEALMLEFDAKMSNSAVEEYATTVLGMQKRENSQTEWVDLGTGDVFEYTAGRSVFVRLRDWLVGLGA